MRYTIPGYTLLRTPYIPCPGGYEGMEYDGTSKYMFTSITICMYCMHMHMLFTREEHAVVPCEPTTTSPLTVRHEIHMCCAPAPCQHCSHALLVLRKTLSEQC